jgi:hypothetical protein
MGTSTDRRLALKFGLSACISALLGCGIGNNDDLPLGGLANLMPTAPDPPPDSPPLPTSAVWDPSPWLVISSIASTVTIDMSITLPAGVRRGGIFGLAANSSALPEGATLSRAGILSVANSKVSTSNLIFTYSEPVL